MTKKLMLHVGPGRTGTTWLWDTIIKNKLYNQTVKVNHSKNFLEYVHKLLTYQTEDPQTQKLMQKATLAINLATKEDLPMYIMNQFCRQGPIDQSVLDKQKYAECCELFGDRLWQSSSRSQDMTEWNKWYSSHSIQQASLICSYMGLLTVMDQVGHIIPHLTDHLPDHTPYIGSEMNSKHIALKMGLWENDLDWKQSDLWELRLVPNWSRLEGAHHPDDSERTVLSGNMQQGAWRFPVQRFNGEASVDHYLNTWLPSQQQFTLDCVHSLCAQYDQVVVVVGLRNVQQQQHSHNTLMSRVFHHDIMNSFVPTNTAQQQKLELAAERDIRVFSLMNQHRHRITDAGADEIRHFYKHATNQSQYSTLEHLATHQLPSNCELRTYDFDQLADADYVSEIFAEILPSNIRELNNFGEKSFSTAEHNTVMPLQPSQIPPSNPKLLKRNQTALEAFQ